MNKKLLLMLVLGVLGVAVASTDASTVAALSGHAACATDSDCDCDD